MRFKINNIYIIPNNLLDIFRSAIVSLTLMTLIMARLIASCPRGERDFACSRNKLAYIIDGPLPINCSSRSCHVVNHRASDSNTEEEGHEWFGCRKCARALIIQVSSRNYIAKKPFVRNVCEPSRLYFDCGSSHDPRDLTPIPRCANR